MFKINVSVRLSTPLSEDLHYGNHKQKLRNGKECATLKEQIKKNNTRTHQEIAQRTVILNVLNLYTEYSQ